MRASNQNQSISTQTGIRQRSLRKHCRLGRTTELVFVMATGAMLVLSGGAQAQAVDLDWDTNNTDGTTVTGGAGAWKMGGVTNLWNDGNANVSFTSGDNAEFGGLSAYTVTVESLGLVVGNISIQANIGIDGGPLTVEGAVTVGPAQTVSLQSDVTDNLVTNVSGTLKVFGNVAGELTAVNPSGLLQIMSPGSVIGTTTVTAGTVAVDGGALSTVTVDGGILDVNSGTVGAVTVNGGTLDIDGGTVASLDLATGTSHSISGTAEVTGATTIDSATLTQTGAGSKLSTNGTTASTVTVNSGGVYQATDGIAGEVTNNGGTITADGTNFVSLTNTSGIVTIKADKKLEAGSLRNDGTLILEANATFEGTGNTFNNAGVTTVADGGSIIDAGAINNLATGTLTFAGTATVNADSDGAGGEIVTNAGTFIVNDTGGSTVAVGGDAFTNSSMGTIAVNGNSTLSGITTLTNTSTSLDAIKVAAGGTLTAATLNSDAGTITVAGTLDAATTIKGGILDVDSGAVGAVTVDGGTLDMDGGTVASLINTSGTNTTVDGGSVSGTTTVTAGTVTVAGGAVGAVDVE